MEENNKIHICLHKKFNLSKEKIFDFNLFEILINNSEHNNFNENILHNKKKNNFKDIVILLNEFRNDFLEILFSKKKINYSKRNIINVLNKLFVLYFNKIILLYLSKKNNKIDVCPNDYYLNLSNNIRNFLIKKLPQMYGENNLLNSSKRKNKKK